MSDVIEAIRLTWNALSFWGGIVLFIFLLWSPLLFSEGKEKSDISLGVEEKAK